MTLIHKQDLSDGFGKVYLPYALQRKYPNENREFGWQYIFPSLKHSVDTHSGNIYQHHILASGLQKAVKRAVERTDITKRVGCHTFRHNYDIHLLENGVNIRVFQKLMGHSNVKTTEIYTHVMEKNIDAVLSPPDVLIRLKK